jgi:ribosomal protein L21
VLTHACNPNTYTEQTRESKVQGQKTKNKNKQTKAQGHIQL